MIIASVFIVFVLSVSLLTKSAAEPIISPKPKEAVEKPQKVIYLEGIECHKSIKEIINNSEAIFMLDTGASTTLISDDFLNELINDGFISRENNYLGIDKYTIANDSIVKGEKWQLPSITIGEITLNDIKVVALKNITSSGFLLGMSTLEKLGDYTIVPNENKILVKN